MSQFFNIKNNKGFFETEIPFNYSSDNNVIGWLYNEEKECICMTAIPDTLLEPIN